MLTVSRISRIARVAQCGVLTLVGAVSACNRAAPPTLPQAERRAADSEVVATVDGETITANQLRQAMVRYGGTGHRFEGAEAKDALLQELLRVAVLAAMARKSGYEEDPEIRETVRRVLADRYRDDLARQNPVPPVTDDEVRAYYEAHLQDYTAPASARASVIVLKFPAGASVEDRAALRRTAEAVRADALRGKEDKGAFAALARERSNDRETRDRSGDIGWLPRGVSTYRVEPSVVEAIFSLDAVGDIAPLVETQNGFYVVQLTGRNEGRAQPLDSVARGIRQTLFAERSRRHNAEIIDRLGEQFEIAINRDVLMRVGPISRVASNDERPPSFPVGEPPQ